MKRTTREERERLRDDIVDILYHDEHYDTDPPKEVSELVLRLIADVERLTTENKRLSQYGQALTQDNQVRWMEKHDILAAEITALREGLKDLDYELNLYVATGGDWKNPRKLIHKLLSSPNPGAKVEAVVEAARAWEIRKRELHHYSWDLPLIEAVRALDKEESDETKD